MPDRVIRDELLTSERYWSVSIEAQQLFTHLLLCADSLGRFSGKNFTVRMACYPAHQRSPDLVEKFLNDLNDADLIRIYEVDGERFIFIPRYKQRLRYTDSKYPAPPNEINDIVIKKSDSSPTQVRPAPLEVKRRNTDGGLGSPASSFSDAPASADQDPWKLGKEFLIKRGVTPSTVGGFLGKLIKDHGKPAVIEALQSAITEEPAEVKSYLVSVLRGKRPGKFDPTTANLAFLKRGGK